MKSKKHEVIKNIISLILTLLFLTFIFGMPYLVGYWCNNGDGYFGKYYSDGFMTLFLSTVAIFFFLCLIVGALIFIHTLFKFFKRTIGIINDEIKTRKT